METMETNPRDEIPANVRGRVKRARPTAEIEVQMMVHTLIGEARDVAMEENCIVAPKVRDQGQIGH